MDVVVIRETGVKAKKRHSREGRKFSTGSHAAWTRSIDF